MQRPLTQLLLDLHAGLVALSGAVAELAAAMAPPANVRCEFLQRLTANGNKWVRSHGNLKGLTVVSDRVIVMIHDRCVAACDTRSVDANVNGHFVKMGDDAAIRKRKQNGPPIPLALAAHSTAVVVCYGTDYGVQQHAINGTRIEKPVPLTACPIPGGHTAVGIAVKTVRGHNLIALQHAADAQNESSAHVITGFGASGASHVVAILPKKGVFAFTDRGLVAVVEEGSPCHVVVYSWECRLGAPPIAMHQLDGVSAVTAIGFDDAGRLIVLSDLRNAASRTVSWWITTPAPARMVASLDVSNGPQLCPCMAVHGDGTVAVALECGPPGAGTICVIKV